MALETATWIDQLVPSNPTVTDPLAQFYAHVNLIKQVLQNQFPNAGTVAVTASAAALNAAAAAFAAAPVVDIQPNGTVAAAELDLLGMINSGGTIVSGRVELLNTSTLNGPAGLAIKMTNSVDASPTTPMTLTVDGTLAAAGAMNAPSIQQGGHALVPSGMVMLWPGSVATIPAGWVLCDGTNGTVDMRNAFIVGAGGTYTPSATGGAASVTATTTTAGAHNHTGADGSAGSHNHGGASAGYSLQVGDLAAHSHAITVTDPGHVHSAAGNFVILGGAANLAAGGSAAILSTPATNSAVTGISVTEGSVGSGTAHSHGISSDGAHTHSISTDGNHAHAVTVATLPPYLAACWVMKT